MKRPAVIQGLLRFLTVLRFAGLVVAFLWQRKAPLLLGAAVVALWPIQLHYFPGHAVLLWSLTAASVVALLLAAAVLHARRQLVIETFADHRRPQNDAGLSAASMASLLVAELGHLVAAHSQHDPPAASARADGGPGMPTDPEDDDPAPSPGTSERTGDGPASLMASEYDLRPVLGTSDLARFISGAVSSDASMSVGPVTLPLGPLGAIAGRLAQGPRLVGAIFGDANSMVVEAQLVGSATVRTWRVERRLDTDDLSELDRTRDLVRELACRVFTDLARPGTTRWRAARAFVDGLAAYRESSPHPERRAMSLHRAADRFRDAIHEDPTFSLAQYNLGIVSEWLARAPGRHNLRDGVEPVLRAAIANDPGCWYTYHALASHRYELSRQRSHAADLLPEVVSLCDRMRAVAPDAAVRARALLLRGRALRRLGRRRPAIHALRRSGRWAFVALCGGLARSTTRHRADADAIAAERRALAGAAWGALAAAEEDAQSFRRAAWHYWLVIACNSADVEAWSGLARIYTRTRRPSSAVAAYLQALTIAPDNHGLLVQAALSAARGRNYRACLDSVDRILAHPSRLSMSDIDALRSAVVEMMRALTRWPFWLMRTVYWHLDVDGVRASCVERLVFLAEIRKVTLLAERLPETLPLLRRLRLSPRRDRFAAGEWAAAKASVTIARHLLNPPDGNVPRHDAERAATILGPLAERLAILFPDEIALLRVDDLLVAAQEILGRRGEMLMTLRVALDGDPLSGHRWAAIAQRLQELGNVEGAALSMERALRARGDDIIWHLHAGLAHYGVAQSRSRRAGSRAAQERAVEHLEAARDLAPPNPDIQGPILALLGAVHLLRGWFDEASTTLTQAHNLQPGQISALWFAAEADLRRHRHAEARDGFRKVLAELDKQAGRPAPDGAIEADVFSTPLDVLRAQARIGLVNVLAETGGLAPRIQRYLRRAHEAVLAVPQERRRSVMSSYRDACGWVAFKRGDLKRAVTELATAVALDPGVETYWRLAQALATQAASMQRARARIDRLERAIACCRQVADTGVNTGMFDQLQERADQLRRELEQQAAAMRWTPGPTESPKADDHAQVSIHASTVQILPIAASGTEQAAAPAGPTSDGVAATRTAPVTVDTPADGPGS